MPSHVGMFRDDRRLGVHEAVAARARPASERLSGGVENEVAQAGAVLRQSDGPRASPGRATMFRRKAPARRAPGIDGPCQAAASRVKATA